MAMCVVLSAQIASLPLSFVLFAKATGRTVRQIWTNEGSKRIVPCKEVPFGGLNDVPLKPQKLKLLGT